MEYWLESGVESYLSAAITLTKKVLASFVASEIQTMASEEKTTSTEEKPTDEVSGVGTENSDDGEMPAFLDYLDENLIGGDVVFEGPFGEKKVIYCDYTASGKPLRFIEDYIRDFVFPMYANTHTTTTTLSRQTTKYRQEAREIIKECVNATNDDVMIFTGSGTTGAIHKLIHALEMKGEKAKQSVVFVGPFEHHSNILPWKESGAKIVRIRDNENGTVDMKMLETSFKFYQNKYLNMYAAFSAASNVTGILTDTVAVSEVCHKYGVMSFWDYATAAPYLKIDMNPTETGYKDAVFLSPHKFVGGPGTPGVLIAKKNLFTNPIPGGCGGGSVLFVTRDTHLYLEDIESREEGGTPAIIESIRAGLVFQLKQAIGSDLITAREEELCRKAFKVWSANQNLTILGSSSARRLPIFSILMYHQDSGKLLHHNFVSVLLNDLYGIQARGGCACAGPYAQDLLGIKESVAQKFTWFLESHKNDGVVECQEPLEIIKPGFARLNLPYFMDDETVHFVLEAVDMIATHGWKLLPQYRFDPYTGAWEHREFTRDKTKGKAQYSLRDITYSKDGIHVKSSGSPRDFTGSLDEIAQAAFTVLDKAAEVNNDISTVEDEVIEFSGEENKLVWFLQPREAQIHLATGSLKYKPFRRTTLPFRPRKTTRRSRTSDSLRLQYFREKYNDRIEEEGEELFTEDGPKRIRMARREPIGATIAEHENETEKSEEMETSNDTTDLIMKSKEAKHEPEVLHETTDVQKQDKNENSGVLQNKKNYELDGMAKTKTTKCKPCIIS